MVEELSLGVANNQERIVEVAENLLEDILVLQKLSYLFKEVILDIVVIRAYQT